jgi:large subunit ribosomal protein L17
MSRRHQAKLPKLNRSSNQRAALFRTQLGQIIEHGTLTTTVVKAKVIKRLFDRLASKAVDATLSDRRRVAAILGNPKSANKLVDLIVPAMGGRKSGFTTIQKVSTRKGDSVDMATLSFVIPMPTRPEVVKEVKNEDKKPAVSKTKKTK